MKSNFGKIVLLTIAVGVVGYSAYVSYCDGKLRDYFCVPFEDVLSIVILGLILYWYTEGKNDERQVREFLKSRVEQLSKDILDPVFVELQNERDIGIVRIRQRSVDNRLEIIEEYADRFGFRKDIVFSKKKFQEYWKEVSERIDNIDELVKSEAILRDKISSFSDGLERILKVLYRC